MYKIVVSGLTGTQTLLAGSLLNAGFDRWTRQRGHLQRPLGTGDGRGGNLYANDFFNNTIRVISPAGVVSTLAGVVGQEQLITGAVPGSLPDIGGLVVVGQGLYTSDLDDSVVLQIAPLP